MIIIIIVIIIDLFIFGLKTPNILQQFKYKNDIKQYFTDVKRLKNKPKVLSRFYATDLLQEPSPFHMCNLAKLEAC